MEKFWGKMAAKIVIVPVAVRCVIRKVHVGRYTYTLRVAGDHGVNGTCRGKITID